MKINSALESLASTITVSVFPGEGSNPETHTLTEWLSECASPDNKDLNAEFGGKLPVCTPSASFDSRGNIYYNGVVVARFPGLDDSKAEIVKRQLIDLPYVIAAVMGAKDEVVAYILTDNRDAGEHEAFAEEVFDKLSEAKDGGLLVDTDFDTEPGVSYKQPFFYDGNPAINVGVEPFSLPEYNGPTIDTDLLPPLFRDIVLEASAQYKVRPEVAFAFLYGALCTLVGKRYALVDRGYYNCLNSWICVVSHSGKGKTPTLDFFFNPIKHKEGERINALQNAVGGLMNKDGSTPRHRCRRYITNDTTPEERNGLLYDNDEQLTFYADEVKMLFDRWGRYHSGRELNDLLSMRSHQPVFVDRKGDLPLCVERPNYNIVGGTQDAFVKSVFGQSELVDSGFSARWLWVWPESYPIRTNPLRQPNVRVTRAWSDVIDFYLGFSETRELKISQGAEQIYNSYYRDIERKSRRLDAGDPLAWSYSKLEINVIELALAFQAMSDYQAMIDNGTMPSTGELSEMSMRAAVAYCKDYFEHTAEKVVREIRSNRTGNSGKTEMPSREDAIRALFEYYPKTSQNAFAKTIGVSQPFVSKVLKKANKQNSANTTEEKRNANDTVDPNEEGSEPALSPSTVIQLWKELCPRCEQPRFLTEERRRKIKSRIENMGADAEATIRELFTKINASDFLVNGSDDEGHKNWRVSFDWVFENDNNWAKVLEGKYDNHDAEAREEEWRVEGRAYRMKDFEAHPEELEKLKRFDVEKLKCLRRERPLYWRNHNWEIGQI